MGAASKVGDWAFKAFTLGLGVATIYLTATFSVNVYRGLSWHKAQSVAICVLNVSKVASLNRLNMIVQLLVKMRIKIGVQHASNSLVENK
ncbi:hypothetical protein RJ641_009237 [Dillenia turbinata]|uniref:Uncharacterized protein n=1 Tax=Dillenia turbinata TaxID=194707 RepID=A0AAN8V7D6_9MAGN